jgi:hypothetical protein
MRGMALPLRWIVPASALALALTACTGGSPQTQTPSATVTVSPGEPGTAATPSPPSATATASAAPEPPPQSVITNEPPPGGTVTSNASPAPAGSDRMNAMMDLVKANRDGFRKCFDLWGKKNPGQAGKIAFQFFLKPDGELEKAAFKRDEGDVFAPEIESCMIAFAKTLAYPKSAVGKPTIYTHRFEFKATPK